MHVDVKGTRFKVTTGDGQSLTVAGPLGIEELTAPRLIVGSDRYPIDPKIYPKLGGTRVYSTGGPPSLTAVPAEAMPICSWKERPTSPTKFNAWAYGRPRKLTSLHEMDRDPSKGGPTPAAWIEEDAELEALMVAHPNAANLQQIDIFTGFVSRHKPARSWDQFYRKSTVAGRVRALGFDLEVDRTAWPKGYPQADKFQEVALFAFRDSGVGEGWFTEYGWPWDEANDPDMSHLRAFYQDSFDYAAEQTIARVLGIFAYDFAAGSTGDYLLRGNVLADHQKRMAAQFVA
jgi:hypothetical protein